MNSPIKYKVGVSECLNCHRKQDVYMTLEEIMALEVIPKQKGPFDHGETDRNCRRGCGGTLQRLPHYIDNSVEMHGKSYAKIFRCNKCMSTQKVLLTKEEADADPAIRNRIY